MCGWVCTGADLYVNECVRVGIYVRIAEHYHRSQMKCANSQKSKNTQVKNLKTTHDSGLVTCNRNMWKSTAILRSCNDQDVVQDCCGCKWLELFWTTARQNLLEGLFCSPGELWSFDPMSCQGKSRTAKRRELPRPESPKLDGLSPTLTCCDPCTNLCVLPCNWVGFLHLVWNTTFSAPVSHLPWAGRWDLLPRETYSLGPKFEDRGKDTGYLCWVEEAPFLSGQLVVGCVKPGQLLLNRMAAVEESRPPPAEGMGTKNNGNEKTGLKIIVNTLKYKEHLEMSKVTGKTSLKERMLAKKFSLEDSFIRC